MFVENPVILCVDDEKPVLDSLKEQLRSTLNGHYVIETAESGADALEIIEELCDDNLELGVIISDYIMPGMKGDELLSTVHEMSPTTLKIMLTGQADVQAVGQAVNQANLYRYIAKPWQVQDLALTVKEALRSFQQGQLVAVQNEMLQKSNEMLSALNAAYERFVPREFLGFLGQESITSVELGDQVQNFLTIMFSDIRSFTQLSEQMTPQENFNFLNGYLNRVSPVIRQNNGFIDKYIGDAVMALFPHQPFDAIRAAIEMQRAVADYNQDRCRKDRQPIQIGIGLHTGSVMLGTIGESKRMESTVISDAVNLTARLEGLTKVYGASILISEKTMFEVEDPNQYHFRFLDRVKVKGKSEPVTVIEILDGEESETFDLKLQTRDDFEKGLLHYHSSEFTDAITYFERVLALHPADKAAQLFLDEANRFLAFGTPNGWEGVRELVEK
ncbi:MAG: adenylate/guanylate cyclase domain-containing protein [Chloroflexota bacterium]